AKCPACIEKADPAAIESTIADFRRRLDRDVQESYRHQAVALAALAASGTIGILEALGMTLNAAIKRTNDAVADWIETANREAMTTGN
ncbi:MAG TPA: hypothetical protein VG433_16895, partial [Pirellulales bacterium]|nr:hypothetical protein [Pirellulales bacterium]